MIMSYGYWHERPRSRCLHPRAYTITTRVTGYHERFKRFCPDCFATWWEGWKE